MNETKFPEISPQRTLKLYQGVIYGIGCGIGGSIFVLLSTGIEYAQSGVLLSLILGGVLIFFTGLNYAELSTSLPIAGGAYNFTKQGIGGFLAFIIGFFLWIANTAASAFAAQIFALLFRDIFNIPQQYNFIIVIISILPILLTSIVFFRTQKIAIKALLILTFILIAMFIVFTISGLFIAQFTNPSSFNPSYLISNINFLGVIPSFLLLFIFFTSITSNLAYLNADLKNPSRNIPRVNIYAIIITLLIYLSVTSVVLINVGEVPSELKGTTLLLAYVYEKILGPFGFYFMVLATIISTFIAINAGLGSAVSVITALARDRYIPKSIKKVNKREDMPSLALFITAFLAIIITVFAGIGLTGETINLIYFIGLAFVNYAAVKLRRKRKELDRPFKAPLFPILPMFIFICFLTFAFILGVIYSFGALILGIIISAIGFAYYLLTIADKPSKGLTLAGIKFFFIVILGLFIYIINNFSIVNSNVILINRILITICVFALITVILDLIPLRELSYFFVRKMDKTKVAIDLGSAKIITLGKKRTRVIHIINTVVYITQFIFVGIIFFITFLLLNNSIVINYITLILGTKVVVISNSIANLLFIISLGFFGIILFFSGFLYWHRNRELKSIGI
ncbi:MAG: APC family permease [Candidatus Thorarchaeota archaeon]